MGVHAQLASAMTTNEQLHAELEDHAASRLAATAALNEARGVVDTQAERIDELDGWVSSMADDCVDAMLELSTARNTIRMLENSQADYRMKMIHEGVRTETALQAQKELAVQVTRLHTQVRSLQLELKARTNAVAVAVPRIAAPTHTLPSSRSSTCLKAAATVERRQGDGQRRLTPRAKSPRPSNENVREDQRPESHDTSARARARTATAAKPRWHI